MPIILTNPLFLGLLIAGLVLVIAVIVYNVWQERRLRRRKDAALRKPSDDVPLRPGQERVEPKLRGEQEAAVSMPGQSVAIETASAGPFDEAALAAGELLEEPLVQRLPGAKIERGGVAPDSDIECVVLLRLHQPVLTTALSAALTARIAKPGRWLGRRAAGLPWQIIDSSTAGPWQEIAACLLLANRSGAVTRADVDAFLRVVAQVASTLPAACALPDAAEEAARAETLDRFCADLDVQIGLTILKGELGQIAGTRLRGVAEAAGFHLSPAGHFDYVQEETGAVLFSLQNYKQEPFTVEGLRAMVTPGVVFLLDVPRVGDPVKVFDQMRLVAKRLTQTLEGVLVDDNRRPLNDTSLAAIRGQVQATAAALRESNIEPGGPRALRLFG